MGLDLAGPAGAASAGVACFEAADRDRRFLRRDRDGSRRADERPIDISDPRRRGPTRGDIRHSTRPDRQSARFRQ
jgi:hypothetical protein